VKVLRLSTVSTRLETAAQDWYGTPYKWGGNSKQGVDCSGFVKNLYKEAFAVSLPRVTETQLQAGAKVARDQIRPGDLVFFRPENDYNHVGVYIGEGTFVHASSSKGVTEAPMEKNYWEQYYWTSRRPLKPSRVPDSLTSDLVAYQYPDTTVQATDSPQAEMSPTTRANGETQTAEIASCEDSGVQCADPAVSPRGSADTTRRKGW
jgi:hypothetical protein